MKFIIEPQKIDSGYCFCPSLGGSSTTSGCTQVCQGNCSSVCVSHCAGVGGPPPESPGTGDGGFFGPGGVFGPGGLWGNRQ